MGFSSSYPLFLSLFLFFLPLCKSDLESERSALLALRAAVGGKVFLWNVTQPFPCTWKGVKCQENSVVELRLPGDGLSGQLPSGIFGNLTHLHTLSLRLNALTGSLPEDLSSCTDLRYLYLQGNKLSGEIPAFLFKLQNLVRLNLATNNFSGEISPLFNNLNTLRTLYLENNKLTGSIPEIDIPSLVQVNVSFNQLNGSIPSKIRSMPSSSFEGNSLCGGPLVPCPNEGKNKKKLSGGAIAGIVIGSVIGVFLILLIFFVLCRKKSNRDSKSMEIAPVKQSSEVEIPTEKGVLEGRSGGYPAPAMVPAVKGEINPSGNNNKKLIFFGNVARVFDLEDLLRASAEVLGKGTFGTAYKAVLEMGITVAVKRLKDVTMAEKEFREKIEAVGLMDHENLVPLRAYYFSRDEKLLVYDYMPMGSLSALLHGNRGGGRTPLNWEARSSIALGAARGIEYLHSKGPNFSHGNIKSSNILLTKSYDPCVSDFGLNQLVGLSPAPTRIAGYQAPEVTDARKVSQKADVYSFGVLLLELLTGKAPTHALLNEGVDLPRWVQSVVREEWESEVFDLELLRYQNVEEEMVQLLQLGIDCAAQYPDKRPLMSEVTRRIEELLRSSIGRDEQRHQPSDLDDDDDDQSRRTDSIGSGPPPSSNLD